VSVAAFNHGLLCFLPRIFKVYVGFFFGKKKIKGQDRSCLCDDFFDKVAKKFSTLGQKSVPKGEHH
jgi:hypothetical protein